jgi:hypothetical protein
MATAYENLKTRRAAICVELAALTATTAGGKPNGSGGSGSVDHVGYKDGLYRELKEINGILSQLEDEDGGGGCYEVETLARG